MERMSGIDPMFVYSDTPETPMEIAYACVFDPATAEGGYSFGSVRGVLESRMPTLTPFRRRLVPVPLGLDHPRWVDDPEFDLGDHLHRAAVPHPGGEREFTDLVAKVMGRPLQTDQPPWEMHVVEGLADGLVGLIAKVHHSVIDGVAGAQLLAQLLDLTPEGSAVTGPCPPWLPARLPSSTRLVTDALPSFFHSPVRAVRAVREVGRTAVRLARCAFDDDKGPVSIPLGAPPTFESPVGRPAGGRLRRVGPGGGAHRQGPLRLHDQRRRAGRLLGCPPLAPGRARSGHSTARSSPSCPSRCGPTRGPMPPATSSRPCSSRSPTTARHRWSGCAR